MGTSKSGRYLNTKGSGRSVNDFALVHSSEGAFTHSQTCINGQMVIKLRLNNGGHSQKGMDLLDKYDIKYNVVKTYPNGVRIGNVPNHMQRSKRSGTSQAWFPKSWTERDIRRAGEHVSGLKGNRHIGDGKKYMVYIKVCELELFVPMERLQLFFLILTKINGCDIYEICRVS